jgi:hypothetical protein
MFTRTHQLIARTAGMEGTPEAARLVTPGRDRSCSRSVLAGKPSPRVCNLLSLGALQAEATP